MSEMIPVGYLAKKVSLKPEQLKNDHVIDIYSVSACISTDFTDYVSAWKHNGYWLFDSPQITKKLSAEQLISLESTALFYYEAYELEYDTDKENWHTYAPELSLTTRVISPAEKHYRDMTLFHFHAQQKPSVRHCHAIIWLIILL